MIPELAIELQAVSKRFGRQWIIREMTDRFATGSPVGVSGRNGAGKSTLQRLLCGQLTPTRGSVRWTLDGRDVPVGDVYRSVSWAAPYLTVVEELTIRQFYDFHFRLKPLQAGLTVADVPRLIELDHVRNRKLSDCSSGMRQRVLLGSVLYAATPLLLLDEPTVTLDAPAVAWYHQQLATYGRGRLVVVASNDPADLVECGRVIAVGEDG